MSDEVDQIKTRLDVSELVGEYVKLKKTGHHYKGLCPFHQEKTPSMVVSPGKGIWHCFGCGKGGDVFSFVQEIEGLDFPASLKLLAERTGVELKAYKGGNKESRDEKQRLYDMLELVARFYNEILINQKPGKKALKYLEKRGVKKESIQGFQLGYAPNKWDTLQIFLRSRGYSESEMKTGGLVGISQRGTYYDLFRGRIIFPIRDTQGRVVAFGGRIAPWHETGEEGKYINSPETKLYEKRRIVFNLDQAKQHLRGGDPCIVVEGYMDVVMMSQVGIGNVVASSGTAFTEEAIVQLKRFTQELYFAFDADVAGAKAGLAATESAFQAGVRVKTIVLPAGKDPADLAIDGAKKLKKMINEPKSVLTVLLDRMQNTNDGQQLEDRLDEIIPFIAKVENPILQGSLIQEIAGTLHVAENRILEKVQGVRVDVEDDELGGGQELGATTLSIEARLISFVLVEPKVRIELMKGMKEGFILDESVNTLYNELHGLAKKKKFESWSPDELIESLSEKLMAMAEGLRQLGEDALEKSKDDALVEGQTLLRKLKKRQLESKLKKLQYEVASGDEEGHDDSLREFQKTLNKLSEIEN